MKKIFCSLLILATLLISATALAAYRENIPENADLTAVKRLAIALPMHYKTEDAEPTLEEFTQIVFDASKSSRIYVISYEDIAASILKDTGVDITALSDLESRRIFNENVANYADAFLTVTTANNSKKVQFFFEVQKATGDQLLYLLTTQSGEIGKNSKDYLKACENFYSRFNAAIEKNLKDSSKKKK